MLGTGRTATYDAVRRGELPHIKVGRRFVIPTAAVRRLLEIDEPRAS
jgi:excisionase family DNA binding protein